MCPCNTDPPWAPGLPLGHALCWPLTVRPSPHQTPAGGPPPPRPLQIATNAALRSVLATHLQLSSHRANDQEPSRDLNPLFGRQVSQVERTTIPYVVQ